MQGFVKFNQPIERLPYRILGASWQVEDNKATITVAIYLSQEDFENKLNPILRTYYAPMTDFAFANQLDAFVKTLVETGGMFTLEQQV